MKRTTVYCMVTDSAVKVGITGNLKHRLRTVQTGNPLTVSVPVQRHVATREQAQEIEYNCHVRADKYRLQGEWFQLDALPDIMSVLCDA